MQCLIQQGQKSNLNAGDRPLIISSVVGKLGRAIADPIGTSDRKTFQ